MHKICFTISFISCLYMFRAPCARNMYRHEIKLIVKQILCIKLVKYWDKYTEMHGQQNVKTGRWSLSSAETCSSTLCNYIIYSCVSVCHMSHITRYMSHGTCHMLHTTCHMLHVTCHMLHVTCHTLCVLHANRVYQQENNQVTAELACFLGM